MSQLFVGVDWSQSSYDVAVLAANGALLTQFIIVKTPSGFKQLIDKINEIETIKTNCLIGIETAYNVLTDFLLSSGYSVYVISPSIVSGSRGRFGNSGAHTDKTDARLIADLLRTDRARFAPWRPNSDLLETIQTKLNLVDSLTKSTTQQANQLRAILDRVYPQIPYAFPDLKAGIVLEFLMAYPAADKISPLSYKDFVSFCHQHHCYRQAWITKWFGKLQHAQPQPDETLAKAYQGEIMLLSQLLLIQMKKKQETIREVQSLFEQHPDQSIFSSLPGAGDLLAPKLLAMFGEDRERFPTPQDIRSLAGTCPVTQQSGKSRRISFRRACNHDHRHTVHQFAVSSCKYADWARTYYGTVLARSRRKNHAYRCLANRWLGIVWKMWQTGQPYDETYHLKQLQQHRRPS